MRAQLMLSVLVSASAFAADSNPSSWVLFDGSERNHMRGSTSDLKRASQARGERDRLFWFQTSAGEFVITDAQTLEAVHATFEPLEKIAKEMEKLGEEERHLGEKQEAMSEELAERAEEMAEEAQHHRNQVADDAREAKAMATKMTALSRQMEKLGARMETFGKAMELASTKMNADINSIIETAVKKGLARATRAS